MICQRSPIQAPMQHFGRNLKFPRSRKREHLLLLQRPRAFDHLKEVITHTGARNGEPVHCAGQLAILVELRSVCARPCASGSLML